MMTQGIESDPNYLPPREVLTDNQVVRQIMHRLGPFKWNLYKQNDGVELELRETIVLGDGSK